MTPQEAADMLTEHIKAVQAGDPEAIRVDKEATAILRARDEERARRERQIARLTGIAVELDAAALGLLSTFAESLHASPGATRDLTSKALAEAQHDRDRGIVREPAPRDVAAEMRGSIMAEIAAERDRQIAKWGDGLPSGGFSSVPTGADRARLELARERCEGWAKEGRCTMRHILEEEVAEVFAEKPGSQLQRAELIQVAAVCVKWIEGIDAQDLTGERDPRPAAEIVREAAKPALVAAPQAVPPCTSVMCMKHGRTRCDGGQGGAPYR